MDRTTYTLALTVTEHEYLLALLYCEQDADSGSRHLPRETALGADVIKQVRAMVRENLE